MNRDELLCALASRGEKWEIVVIGGGATGLGTAVDACARGYRTVLFEQSDFGKGTSSRSTKLIHGGLRYLRNGHLLSIRRALSERALLLQNAPHLVQPLSFIVPFHNMVESHLYSVAVRLYDALSGRYRLGPTKSLSRSEVRERLANVRHDGAISGISYWDAQFDDARMAINLAQTVVDLGGVALNYCKVVHLSKQSGKINGVVVEDCETGRLYEVRSRVVINATGVFVDRIRRLDEADEAPLVSPSQGTHLVIPRKFFPSGEAMLLPKTEDGRVLFFVPWNGCVILGTTDVAVSDINLEPRALVSEIDFLLSHASKYLVDSPQRDDVLSVYAGLRPLIGKHKTAKPSHLSRDHAVIMSESGLLTVTGGKWTTYRKMAEDVLNVAERRVMRRRKPCQTSGLRLHGAGWSSRFHPPTESPWLGEDESAFRQLMKDNPAGGQRLDPALPYVANHVFWAVRNEMARSVEDVLARRTRALLLDARASIRAAPKVAALMSRELRTDTAWEARQTADYCALAKGYVLE